MPDVNAENAPRRCAGVKKDGSVCPVPEDLLMPDEEQEGVLWCYAHHPGYVEERVLRNERGGLATGRRIRKGPRFLDERDLPELNTPEDAARLSQVITTAMLTGKLNAQAGGIALKAVDTWLRAHDAIELTRRIEELEAETTRAKQERERLADQRRREHPPFLGRST